MPMNVLVAQINYNPHSAEQLALRKNLTDHINRQGGNIDIHFAYNTVELINILQDTKGLPFWLFSNFPPDMSYPDFQNDSSKKKQAPQQLWDTRAYSVSMKLLAFMYRNYYIKLSFIITGAPELEMAYIKDRLSGFGQNTDTFVIDKYRVVKDAAAPYRLEQFIKRQMQRVTVE